MTSASSKTRCACDTMAAPDSVIKISLLLRSNRETPSSSSNFLMAMDKVGWLTWQRCAARPKCFSCATATI